LLWNRRDAAGSEMDGEPDLLDPITFSDRLTMSGSLYFTITVLSTVGFGDITPVADAARLTVSVQMICDLVVIAIIVKLITGWPCIGPRRRVRGIEGHNATGSG
jgi:Ion channel